MVDLREEWFSRFSAKRIKFIPKKFTSGFEKSAIVSLDEWSEPSYYSLKQFKKFD